MYLAGKKSDRWIMAFIAYLFCSVGRCNLLVVLLSKNTVPSPVAFNSNNSIGVSMELLTHLRVVFRFLIFFIFGKGTTGKQTSVMCRLQGIYLLVQPVFETDNFQ